MKLDVAIPAKNEEHVILPTLALVSDVLGNIPGLSWKIIVAVNGSTDKTFEVVDVAKLMNVEVFKVGGSGKGVAIKEAAKRSTATYFGFVDADSSADPKTLATALAFLESSSSDLVIGSRFHPLTKTDRSFLRSLSSRLFNILARSIVGVYVSDTQCPMKIMRSSAKAHLLESIDDNWLLDLEHIARVERDGLLIKEIPVEWTEFRYRDRKSKLSLVRDGGNAFVSMFKLRYRLKDKQRNGAQGI